MSMKGTRLLLLFLAPTLAGQPTAKDGSGGNVHLYEEQGKTLIDSLEKNFYGRENVGPVTLRDSGYLFTPTDPKDHLATHFLQVPTGKRRLARVYLWFPEEARSGSSLGVLVQDRGLATLQQFAPRPDPAGALSTSQDVTIPDSVDAIRVVFVPTDSKPAYLPSRVKIECGYSGSEERAETHSRSGVYLAVIAAGAIGVAILVRLLKRRVAK